MGRVVNEPGGFTRWDFDVPPDADPENPLGDGVAHIVTGATVYALINGIHDLGLDPSQMVLHGAIVLDPDLE